jgi:hypothetical protein
LLGQFVQNRDVPKKNVSSAPKSQHLVGLGLDSTDGHKRLTQGDGFTLAGGSEGTHEKMTEVVIRTTEDLARKGRSLQEADVREVQDLLKKHSDRS